jgi:hypothetical protein
MYVCVCASMYILFASRYLTSPSMGTVLHEIVCSIARSLVRSTGRSLGGQERVGGGGSGGKGEEEGNLLRSSRSKLPKSSRSRLPRSSRNSLAEK